MKNTSTLINFPFYYTISPLFATCYFYFYAVRLRKTMKLKIRLYGFKSWPLYYWLWHCTFSCMFLRANNPNVVIWHNSCLLLPLLLIFPLNFKTLSIQIFILSIPHNFISIRNYLFNSPFNC